MSSAPRHTCQQCGRSNFKSLLGLEQHQRTSQRCQAVSAEGFWSFGENNSSDYGDSSLSEPTEPSVASNGGIDLEPLPLHDDQDATMDELNDTVETFDMIHIDDEQSDTSWGVGNQEETNEGPAGERLRWFKEYVTRIRDHVMPLTRIEEDSIKLMHLLRHKQATLDTYDGVMKWHLEAVGDKNPQNFISRYRMFKKLRERYNLPKDYLQERQITLPSTGAKVNLIQHDARDCVVSLLTDPRFADEDFLHFDDDPLAAPPDNLDHIADINTGLAYRETYNKLITDPGRQMLVPILLYIDGAVTGQFDKLNIEALKMTLGIFKRPARERSTRYCCDGVLPSHQNYAYLDL